MLHKVYNRPPKKAAQGPQGRPFYYVLKKGQGRERLLISPLPGEKVLAAGQHPGDRNFVLPHGKRVLIFEPHADDAAITVGDFLHQLKAAKNQLWIVNLISCHLGLDGALPAKKKKAIRDAEDRKYAGQIGAQICFLRLEFPFSRINLRLNKADGAWDLKHCRFGQPQPADFAKTYRTLSRLKPEVVLLPHPFEHHQMHADSSALALDAIARYLPRRPDLRLFFYGRDYHYFGVSTNIYSLLSRQQAAAKVKLIRTFRSQVAPWDAYLSLYYFPPGKKPKKDELDAALGEFLLDRLNAKERRRFGALLKRERPAPHYCERLIEFTLPSVKFDEGGTKC
jgi:LmbE family N-acetylglucosaminyl deacetylase